MFKLAKTSVKVQGSLLHPPSPEDFLLSGPTLQTLGDVRLEVSGFSNVQASSLFIPSWVIIEHFVRA